MTLEELTKRIQILEDREAIRNLKLKYAMACDDNYNPENLADLFTEDAMWDAGAVHGIKRGRQEIKDFFAGVSERMIFAVHQLLVSEITVEGDSASGVWYAQTLGILRRNKGVWNSYLYEDEYQKVDGKWLISYTKIKHFFTSPYDGGWAKDRHMPMTPED